MLVLLEFKYSWAREGGRAVWEVWLLCSGPSALSAPGIPIPGWNHLEQADLDVVWRRGCAGKTWLGVRFWMFSGVDGAVPKGPLISGWALVTLRAFCQSRSLLDLGNIQIPQGAEAGLDVPPRGPDPFPLPPWVGKNLGLY